MKSTPFRQILQLPAHNGHTTDNSIYWRFGLLRVASTQFIYDSYD